jgi:hypothetical protein
MASGSQPRHNTLALLVFGSFVSIGTACESPDLRCNGSLALCDRRVDQVVFPTTHNAMSTTADNWGVPNQNYRMPRQLADGIRGLMLDTHEFEGTAQLCHGICQIGNQPLSDGLREIREFLDGHPREIVTLIFETYVTPVETEAAFVESGILKYAYIPLDGMTWPTLRELIARDQRLIVFTDKDGGTRPWYLDQFSYAWQNPYAATTEADFSCAEDRGKKGNPIFIFNHFLSNPLPSTSNAMAVNYNPSLIDHARRCQRESGKLANFVTVDYYDIGDLFATVTALNGL